MSVVEPDSPARNTRSRTRARSESQENAASQSATSTSTSTKRGVPRPLRGSGTIRVMTYFMVLTNIHQLLIFLLPSMIPMKRWESPIPRVAAGACFLYWAIAESVFRTKKGKNQTTASVTPEDAGSSLKTGIALIILQNLSLIVFWIQGSGKEIQPLPFSFKQFHTEITWYGLPLLITHLGLALRWLSISALGDFFSRSLAVFDNHRIVDEGIYSVIRHPGYLANLMLLVGSGLVISANPTVVVLIISVFFKVWHFRMNVEEEMLINAKKQAYTDYQNRVPYRLIPGIY